MHLKQLQTMHNTMLGKPLYLVGVLRGYAPLPPFYVSLALTYRCNLKCPFCYQDLAKRHMFGDMTAEDAVAIERHIAKSVLFRPRIHLFGGEPTVAPDFVPILQHFSEYGYRISMTTNGVNLARFAPALRSCKGLSEINVSLNMGAQDSMLNALEALRPSHLYVTLNCPINDGTQNSLLSIVEWSQNSCADCLTFQHTTLTGRYSAQMDYETIRRQVEAIKNRRLRIKVRFLPEIKLRDVAAYYADPSFPNRNKCVYPWLLTFIQPNGDVIPCDEMDVRMGNAKEEPLSSIWNNQKYRSFRRQIWERGLTHGICRRCCHRQYY